METKNYMKKNGETGQSNHLQTGDKVTCKWTSVNSKKFGEYMNHSIQVEHENTLKYVQLTETQANSLKDKGDLTGKTLTAYEYENQYGKFVGVKVE